SLIPFYAAIIIVNMIPDLFFIGPAGFYGLYLFWKGAPVLMGISQEKSIGYTLLTGLIFTVMYVILLQSLSLLVTTVLQVI
ncbi:MAG: hypothetical protein KJ607_06120, partial [Bacteroidetes bacterium]|nr:hypothetical protein [Bacteroidota bacterium]